MRWKLASPKFSALEHDFFFRFCMIDSYQSGDDLETLFVLGYRETCVLQESIFLAPFFIVCRLFTHKVGTI